MFGTYQLYVLTSLACFVLSLCWLLLSSYLTKRKTLALLREYIDEKTVL